MFSRVRTKTMSDIGTGYKAKENGFARRYGYVGLFWSPGWARVLI